jgi:hypothetical protein
MDEPVIPSSEEPTDPVPHYRGVRRAEPTKPLMKYSAFAIEKAKANPKPKHDGSRKSIRKAMLSVLSEKFPDSIPPEPAIAEPTQKKQKGRRNKKIVAVENLPNPPAGVATFETDEPKSTRRAPRPWSDCDDDYDFLFRLAAAGMTLAQLAIVFNVSTTTVAAWKRDPRYAKYLQEGKDVADEAVVRSLWERANGYSWDDTAVTSYQGNVEKTPIVKHMAPDVLACIFWLKNRRPNEWKDRKEVSTELKAAVIHDIRKLPLDQLTELTVNPAGVLVSNATGHPDGGSSGTGDPA